MQPVGIEPARCLEQRARPDRRARSIASGLRAGHCVGARGRPPSRRAAPTDAPRSAWPSCCASRRGLQRLRRSPRRSRPSARAWSPRSPRRRSTSITPLSASRPSSVGCAHRPGPCRLPIASTSASSTGSLMRTTGATPSRLTRESGIDTCRARASRRARARRPSTASKPGGIRSRRFEALGVDRLDLPRPAIAAARRGCGRIRSCSTASSPCSLESGGIAGVDLEHIAARLRTAARRYCVRGPALRTGAFWRRALPGCGCFGDRRAAPVARAAGSRVARTGRRHAAGLAATRRGSGRRRAGGAVRRAGGGRSVAPQDRAGLGRVLSLDLRAAATFFWCWSRSRRRHGRRCRRRRRTAPSCARDWRPPRARRGRDWRSGRAAAPRSHRCCRGSAG